MFTVGPVHARDHGAGYSIAGVWNRPLGLQEDLIGCPFQDGTKKEGDSAPLDHLEALIGSEKCIFIIIFTITFSYLFI